MGEVGLGGEVRRINQIQARVTEAEKLGFKQCVLPAANLKEIKTKAKIELFGVSNIQEALKEVIGC